MDGVPRLRRRIVGACHMSITIRPARAGDGALLTRMIRELAVHHGYEAYFSALPEDYEKFLADPAAINGALCNNTVADILNARHGFCWSRLWCKATSADEITMAATTA